MKQTAVEWLVQELKKSSNYRGLQNIGITHQELFEQAKEMEKQQIMMAVKDSWYMAKGSNFQEPQEEQYYIKEYGGKQ